MASTTNKRAPERLIYTPAPPPMAADTALSDWVRNHELQVVNAFRRVNKALQDILEATEAPSTPGGGGGPPPAVRIWYYHWHFAYELAGMVLIGRTNTTQWRMTVDDTDANNDSPPLDHPQYVLEAGGTAVQGDMRFGSPFSGPVVHGRHRAAMYRFWVDDEDTVNPVLLIERIEFYQLNAGDMYFGGPGMSFVNKGRPFGHRWEWFVANEGGDLLADAAIKLERYDG